MSRNAANGPFPSASRGQVLLTAAPPVVYGLGIAAAALAAGGPWHSIPSWRLNLSIALTALTGVAILAGGVVAALRRLPIWGYAWAGAAVMMAVLAAQTVAEELAEQGTLELSPVAESVIGLALVLTNLSLLLVAAVRGRKQAGLVSLAQAAILGLSVCQYATAAPFDRRDIALLAAPVGLLMGMLIYAYVVGSGRVRAGAMALLWMANAGLVWVIQQVWSEWMAARDRTSPAIPLLFLLTVLLMAGPILGIILSLAHRFRVKEGE